MVKKKFIDKANSAHYQVVHRSQRDPALADENASPYVLKHVPPSYNLLKKGKYDLEADFQDATESDGEEEGREQEDEISLDGQADRERSNVPLEEIKQSTTNRNIGKEAVAPDNLSGKDASLYGIFFDDQDDYDYLKHLKPIGEDPSAVFMEVKRAQRNQASGGVIFVEDEAKLDSAKRKVTFNLPAEALPSAYEVDVGMLNQPLAPSMFDVSADVREVLYALEDEEYVDEATGDDFFAALDATRIPNDYSQRDTVSVGPQMEVDEEGWFQQFQRYKVQTASSSDDDDGDGRNESASALNWDSRTMDTSYSAMSSSTMFRSDKLALLDDRFDQILEEYSDDEIGELDADDPSVRGDNLVSKVRLESMLDNFLEATEVVGQKKRLVSRVDKTGLIDSVRDTLKESARDAIKLYENEDDVVEEEGHSAIIMPQEKRPDTWDVESVLTTCSNIYNRPKIIYEGRSELAKIQLKGKSGLPVVEGGKVGLNAKEPVGSSRDVTEEAINKGTARPRSESREEKRRRKQVIKEERRCRRIDKKAMKTAFKAEGKRQSQALRNVQVQEQSVHIE